jgi:mono/diheme cytochrome c family protein
MPPTDEDLMRTIARGLPGSAMPAFEDFSTEEQRALVAYLKGLSSAFGAQETQPILLTADPGENHVDLVKGKQLYKDLGCVACHGNAGRGNGPSAKGLLDDRGDFIRAANLTQGWTYRGGDTPQAIAMRVMTGLDGAPMPSYAEAVSAEDAWPLAYFVRSLQEEPRWDAVVSAVTVGGPLPASLTDPRWEAVEPVTVSLGSFSYQDAALVPTTVNAMWMQAVHDEETVVLRLGWDDPTEDRTSPDDALGIVFRPEEMDDNVGSLSLWPSADSSPHLSSTAEGSLAPSLAVEQHMAGKARGPSDQRQVGGSSPLDVLFWSAGSSEIREAVTVGFAPVATGTAFVQPLMGEARHDDGRWTLLIRRPLTMRGLGGSVILGSQRPVRMAIAVWDGGNGEQRRHRSSSAWFDVTLQE